MLPPRGEVLQTLRLSHIATATQNQSIHHVKPNINQHTPGTTQHLKRDHSSAPVAAGAHVPVMLIDQKKVPVFHGEKDKDSLNVIAWCACIKGMKDALGWSDEVTFVNASTTQEVK